MISQQRQESVATAPRMEKTSSTSRDLCPSVLPEEFTELADEMRQIAAVLHRAINRTSHKDPHLRALPGLGILILPE